MHDWLEWEVVTDESKNIKLKDLSGWKLLYFYPKALTSGCTVEAQGFSEMHPEFERMGVHIIGISPDQPETLRRFKDKVGIPFLLVSDPDHKLAQAFGVWKEKNMYGKKTMGIERSTFLIDPEGKITKEWRKVKAAGHAAQVLSALREIIR